MARVKLSIAALAILFFFHCVGSSQEQAPDYCKDGTQAQPTSYYDYIIVGGGTAGCPLAATLSESFKVLLLERGGCPYGNQNITNLTSMTDTLADTSPSSPVQHFTSEDGVANFRARILGGGTCINAGFYSRASRKQLKDMGLDEALANQSYHWVEEALVRRPRLLQWQSALRDGLLEAGVTPYNGFTYDHVNGTKIGGSTFDPDGRRHTAAELLGYGDPSKLTVLLHATVSKVLFKLRKTSKPEAHGVVFWDTAGNEHTAYLNNGGGGDVILSAGTIGSPQLLLLSGIGPADHLKSLGIDLVVEQPMVGQGIRDLPVSAVDLPSPSPVESAPVQVVGITQYGGCIEGISGLHYSLQGRSRLNSGSIANKVASALSRGRLRLVSRDPNDHPSVAFNYFKEPEDLRACVEGLKVISRVVESKAFSEFRYSDDDDSVHGINTSATCSQLEQYCHNTLSTSSHYHGGCHVDLVVDHEYRVVGVDGLRVVDASTFHFSPGTNPQATVLMLGRYMGVKIQSERRAARWGIEHPQCNRGLGKKISATSFLRRLGGKTRLQCNH